ncbi:MAG: transcription termination/antitermination protein NusA [Candidatus Eisenbacteria bacterium]|uniref:Transcription termination/antitermination protein NusA n=1 Tax=Eiseniibacteriota bacterium TaxID=2212470 RepID=A0A849SRA3_UNCEI|nr:transcription termination/antitermination protein NusA [Candidatus Eisenbacteria bacterium]
MSFEILDALSQITREKSVDRALLVETLEAGLASAVRRKHGATADVDVKFSNETGQITITLKRHVVEAVEDPAFQVTVAEARAYPQYKSAQVGEVLSFPLSIAEFGRNAIQTAKQVLIQRVREAEREKVFKEYSDKIGSLVRGVVQQVDRGNVIVKLDHSEGFLPAREQIPRSYHRQGDYVRAVVLNVDKSLKGPQVILSRTHPDFLRRLFETEVPEIADSIVEIKAVAREAGFRSKISVYSNDPRVDAVGSCVGLKGSRVQSIVRELGGERIDIVPWSQDATVFVSRALSPARVLDVKSHEDEHRMSVVVADDQLSLAIGKGGQNARLAARLTGWKIDLVSKSEEKKRHDLERASRIEVEKLELGEATTEKLISAGIETVQELVALPLEKLVEIPGIGEKTAERVVTVAQEYLAAHPPEAPAAVEAFTPEMEAPDPSVSAAASEEASGDAEALAGEVIAPAPPAASETQGA